MTQKNSNFRKRWRRTKLAIAVSNVFLKGYVRSKYDEKRNRGFEGVMDHRNRCNQILH